MTKINPIALRVCFTICVYSGALCGIDVVSDANAAIFNADLGKNLEYVQTDSAGTTVPIGAANAFFYARTFYDSGDFDDGSVSFNSTTLAFNSQSHDCCGSTGGQYQTDYLTKAAMDAAFPAGETTYILQVTDSTHVKPTADIHINLTDDLYTTTAIPTFDAASFNALNSLSAGQGLTIVTSTFTPDVNATGGQSFLSLFDLTANSTVYSAFGPNTRSSWNIGSGIFQAGHQYEAQLIFDNFVSSTDGNVPTAARSDLRTDILFNLAAAVPEPASWALMVLGFGTLGAALRRSREPITRAG